MYIITIIILNYQTFQGTDSQEIYVGTQTNVPKGSIIGRSGNIGRSTGPHLHFEFRIDGTYVDPDCHVSTAGNDGCSHSWLHYTFDPTR